MKGVLVRNCLDCDTTAMITSSFHLYFRSSQFISLYLSFHSRVDELNQLACSPFVGTLYTGSAGRALSSAEATGSNMSNPVEGEGGVLFRNCLNCDSRRWSHIHFMCIPAVHIISFCVSFLSPVDELGELAGLQCIGLYSSAGRAPQRQRRGHGFKTVSPCFSSLAQINRVNHVSDRSTLTTIINNLSKLFYCSSVWSNAADSNLLELQAMQNFAARIICQFQKT